MKQSVRDPEIQMMLQGVRTVTLRLSPARKHSMRSLKAMLMHAMTPHVETLDFVFRILVLPFEGIWSKPSVW